MNRIELKEQKFYKDYQQKIDKENRSERNVESIYEKERESFKTARLNEGKAEKEREREKELKELMQEAGKAEEGMDELCEQLESV
jgi:hypothetical protein